jgi:hypothetical protein
MSLSFGSSKRLASLVGLLKAELNAVAALIWPTRDALYL